jgi:hypothetical protein
VASEVLEEHQSPDGLLRLVVVRCDDGDIAIGFDGYPWHTHPECEASTSNLSESDAVRFLIDRIITNELLIAVARISGVIRDVWPTNDPAGDLKYMPPNESIEFRWWNTIAMDDPRSGGSA